MRPSSERPTARYLGLNKNKQTLVSTYTSDLNHINHLESHSERGERQKGPTCTDEMVGCGRLGKGCDMRDVTARVGKLERRGRTLKERAGR